ncbi:MAG: class I SAM-dependent methyltransferase, partial [Methanothrix sp.]|nr:class I SAM-dependent methyltransferase [Methanothrix sp.]
TWDTHSAALSYSRLGFVNTYYLAYRDLPDIIRRHVRGTNAVDFGCGAGRSSRFVTALGFKTIGIDISPNMIKVARAIDPEGDYRLVSDGLYSLLGRGKYDLVTSIFTFDNIPGWENRTNILVALSELLSRDGRIICLDSTPEIYVNEWASFTTKAFPENAMATTGNIVRDIVLDVEDKTPCEDIFWTDSDYRKLFGLAGLAVEADYRPLGYSHEPFEWVSEKETAPWVIFVLRRNV